MKLKWKFLGVIWTRKREECALLGYKYRKQREKTEEVAKIGWLKWHTKVEIRTSHLSTPNSQLAHTNSVGKLVLFFPFAAILPACHVMIVSTRTSHLGSTMLLHFTFYRTRGVSSSLSCSPSFFLIPFCFQWKPKHMH